MLPVHDIRPDQEIPDRCSLRRHLLREEVEAVTLIPSRTYNPMRSRKAIEPALAVWCPIGFMVAVAQLG